MQEFFEDRREAGKKLVEELKGLNLKSPLILALPRGGVVLAHEIAKFYKTDFDILLVRKIGAPFNPELALGAVVEGNPPQTFMNNELAEVLRVDRQYIEDEKKKEIEELKRRDQAYRGGRPRVPVTGKTVIVVDDGVATGASVRAALQGIRNEKPGRLILAVPVAPPDAVVELKKEVDELVCLTSPKDFTAVGQFYRDFRQVTDEEVTRLLAEKP